MCNITRQSIKLLLISGFLIYFHLSKIFGEKTRSFRFVNNLEFVAVSALTALHTSFLFGVWPTKIRLRLLDMFLILIVVVAFFWTRKKKYREFQYRFTTSTNKTIHFTKKQYKLNFVWKEIYTKCWISVLKCGSWSCHEIKVRMWQYRRWDDVNYLVWLMILLAPMFIYLDILIP